MNEPADNLRADPATECRTVLDTAQLLEPISTEAPTGEDLRADARPTSAYQRLRNARTAARNNERSALTAGEARYINAADWADIVETAPALLRGESKDLEVVAWLVEALTRTAGYPGAAAGFRLAGELIDCFGEALHPQPDEEGKATQLAALTGLNGVGVEGALIGPLRSIPLTAGTSAGPFCAWECQQAFELERVSDPAKREERSQRGFVSRAEIDQAVAETPPEHFRRMLTELQDAEAAFHCYRTALDRYATDDPQPTERIRETLAGCVQILRHIVGGRLDDATAGDGKDAEAPNRRSAGAPEPQGAEAIADRQAAVRQLGEIAHFFRRTEPHSPVSYGIEQVVWWTRLPLPELIRELIPDEGARQKYRTLTGIRDGRNEDQ